MSVLTLRPGKNNKVHLLLDGEYVMTADSDFAAFSGLHDNMILDDEALADLQRKVNARRAFNKASDLLAMRDHSEKELLQKLRQKGFADGAEEAVEKLKGYGYLDDSRFALRFAQELQRVKHYGKKRIEQELFRKGVSRAVVSDTLETSVPGIFACGNGLHVHDLVDYVSLQAARAAEGAADYLKNGRRGGELRSIVNGDQVS